MQKKSKNKPTISENLIKFTIALDQERTPQSIQWEADESETNGPQACKSILISIWDPDHKNTIRFDLWTKDMMQHEMNTLMFQTLLMMGETYSKATRNNELANRIHDFAEEFGIKAKVIKRREKAELKPFKLDT